MVSPARRRRRTALTVAIAALGVAAGCHEATDTGNRQPTQELDRHRAEWAAHRITSYEYDYRVTGFFIAYVGKRIRLVVRDGAVQSATDVETGEPLDIPLTQWPTVERLFDEARDAAAAGLLRDVRFDPQLGYPTQLDLDGPPDASGSVFATGLQQIQ